MNGFQTLCPPIIISQKPERQTKDLQHLHKFNKNNSTIFLKFSKVSKSEVESQMGPLENVPRYHKYDKVGFGGFAFYYVTNMPNLAILM